MSTIHIILCSMLYDPIKGQGQSHGGPKVVKMANFRVCLLCRYAYNQKTNGELWCSKTTSEFFWTNFWYSSSFGVTWPL